MAQIRSILAGVDLSQSYPPGSNNFSPPVQEAIRTALWLAEETKAALTFLTSIEVPDGVSYLWATTEQPANVATSLAEVARELLSQLVHDAHAKGIEAQAEVASGKGWVEIIRRVQRGGYDVVVVGTRNTRGVERFLLGSTAQKLLRNCPSPVWVVRPDRATNVSRIMVASDLQPVSQKALELAAAIAALVPAEVRVVHAVHYPFDRVWATHFEDIAPETYDERARTEAHEILTQQVAGLAVAPPRVEIDLIDGVQGVDLAILGYIEQHQIDMLVMGTVARGGLPGILIGNTAERLLHSVPCSLLAVKPDDFVCPL
ncbi:MAG TPA: universal stress protein [Pirellulales bacterium]|jgi:universal stress protein E|nr:universal stress protein [Pirellulales bacterium]